MFNKYIKHVSGPHSAFGLRAHGLWYRPVVHQECILASSISKHLRT